MTETLFENQTKFMKQLERESDKDSRNSVEERQSSKSGSTTIVSEERNKNNNNYDEDSVEESYKGGDGDGERFNLMFKYYHELQLTFDQIMKSNKVSSETKKECSKKLYEITQKIEMEKYATLTKKLSKEKNKLSEKERKILIHEIKKTKEAFNTNMNSYPRIKKKSRGKSASPEEASYIDEISANNNAEISSLTQTASTSIRSSEMDRAYSEKKDKDFMESGKQRGKSVRYSYPMKVKYTTVEPKSKKSGRSSRRRRQDV